MTPQSNVMVIAPLILEREAELRKLLASMTEVPGQAAPANPVVPFGQFNQIHFARFVILADQTLDDIHTGYGLPRADYPLALAFIADIDGSADDFRADLARRAGDGLQKIFSCCQGFTPGSDLVRWMKDHEYPAAAMYKNWRGRTVLQIREENALRLAIEAHLQSNDRAFASQTPRQVHTTLKQFVDAEVRAGRLTLTAPAPTPFGWWLHNCIHFFALPLILLVLSPFLVLYLPVFLFQLRRREKSDPQINPRIDAGYEHQLARIEDHDVTNQFTVIGSIKPGSFRLQTMRFLLWVLDWTAKHIYIRGHLARISTIHAARWVFINDKKRMVFVSNYDGSLESYMDDFVNKVGWGLNLVFSNGIGYPTTNWLVLDGAKSEQRYKYTIRRHQLPTEVWYKAYPGLTAFDLKRNTLIRQGIEQAAMPETSLRQWLALL